MIIDIAKIPMEAVTYLFSTNSTRCSLEWCLLPSASNNQYPLFKVLNKQIWHVTEHLTNLEFLSFPLYH